MANLASNPWSFVQADVVSTAIGATSGDLTMANGVVTATVTSTTGISANQTVTITGAALSTYNGSYNVLSVVSGTSLLLQPLTGSVWNARSTWPLANSDSGTLAVCLYPGYVRIEDIQWEKPAAGETLDIRDRNGNILWQATYPTGSTAPNWNRGKLFWCNGFTPLSISAGGTGVVIVTVN